MCRKIQCDEESKIFGKTFWELHKALEHIEKNISWRNPPRNTRLIIILYNQDRVLKMSELAIEQTKRRG